MSEISVSIIIPAYNCEKTIEKTIRAIYLQTYSSKEVIVVDDGSSDGTPDIVKKYPDVKYLFQKNSGPATARNTGAQEATGEIMFFTDSDCIPQRDWIEKALAGFIDEKIAVVAGSYGIANENNILARCVYNEIMYRHNTLMPQFPKSFGSYNFCVRKKIFDEVKGFDAVYRHASGEDNDLSYKILKAGYKIFFEKDSIVDHYHPEKLKKYLKEQYRHGFWRVKMYMDHPKMMKGDDYTFFKDVIEVPLVYLLVLFFFLSFLSPFFLSLFLIPFILLLFLECFFGFVTQKSIFDSIFFASVMFLRAFARVLGFSSGIFCLTFFRPTK